MQNHQDDRAERTDVPHLTYNPSAPLTDDELKDFTIEAARILGDKLDRIEHEKETSMRFNPVNKLVGMFANRLLDKTASEALAVKKKELRTYARGLEPGSDDERLFAKYFPEYSNSEKHCSVRISSCSPATAPPLDTYDNEEYSSPSK